MADTEKQIIAFAVERANNTMQRISGLEREKLGLKEQLVAVQAKLDSANGAVDRLKTFRPTLGGVLQCPYCWIDSSLQAPLTPQGSGTAQDWYVCNVCHSELPIDP